MSGMFWRFAHQRYHVRPPSRITELAALTGAVFFIIVYGAALLDGWPLGTADALIGIALIGIALIGIPLASGIMHRRIRLEASKGPDALCRKRIATNRYARPLSRTDP
ncbi:hypothetical protein [Sphingomonas dokdonensis]|uniref:Uncharacterized protein n=1 Tax=Sphingomonas dokdonensis TaxID=344880 RepID=A0A245ZTW5_9SPHN|nr:hypothetical protein [Sphingomonas dokdonensis]OWK33160.1 hypothetical protein SPDO_00340 [Sphingomonas dokdonensis]